MPIKSRSAQNARRRRAILRSAHVAVAAFALGAGCSGGSDEGSSATARTSTVVNGSMTPTDTQRSAPAPTRIIWLGRYALWVTDVRVALEKAGTLQHRRGRPVAVRVTRELGGALDALRHCNATRREKLVPPHHAFARSARLLGRACSLFARGAEVDMRALERGRPDRYAVAFALWSEAAKLVQRANGLLPRPQATQRLPLPVGGGMLEASRVEPLFSSVANEQAAPAAQVRCWAEPEWTKVKWEAFGRNDDLAGFASPEFKRVNLDPRICRRLASLAYVGSRPTGVEQLELAFALDTIMHESGHLNESGDFYGAGANEPLAECWGMQHIRQAARAFGASSVYAAELAERYWREVYPTRPRTYRSPRCRNGGAYDVRPGTDVWP
jgi:hypothetical protein